MIYYRQYLSHPAWCKTVTLTNLLSSSQCQFSFFSSSSSSSSLSSSSSSIPLPPLLYFPSSLLFHFLLFCSSSSSSLFSSSHFCPPPPLLIIAPLHPPPFRPERDNFSKLPTCSFIFCIYLYPPPPLLYPSFLFCSSSSVSPPPLLFPPFLNPLAFLSSCFSSCVPLIFSPSPLLFLHLLLPPPLLFPPPTAILILTHIHDNHVISIYTTL